MASANSPSKILVIGATGTSAGIGQYITRASVAAGHPTYVLVRTPTLSNSAKAPLLDSYRELGITILEGSLQDHEILVGALKEVDVVISNVGTRDCLSQFSMLLAIREAGTIKGQLGTCLWRDRWFNVSVKPRFDAAPLPRYVSLHVENLGFQKRINLPPRDKVEIFGDGEGKISVLDEADVAAYTIKAVDDPRTLNKILSVRPALISPNEMVAIWEKKIGHSLQKTYVSREELMKQLSELEKEPPVPGIWSKSGPTCMYIYI